jgi:hypothetical protein
VFVRVCNKNAAQHIGIGGMSRGVYGLRDVIGQGHVIKWDQIMMMGAMGCDRVMLQ